MHKAYITERYGRNLEIDFESYMKDYGLSIHETDKGFVTYKAEGDALFIYDMYVDPLARHHTHSWELHDHVLAQKKHERVMITFSEFMGRNHLSGIKAMKEAGFVPAFKTNKEFVFIKGI